MVLTGYILFLSDIYKAYCILCLKTIRADDGALSQVKIHERVHINKKND